MNDDTTLSEVTAKLVVALLISMVSAVVIADLWNWFVVPFFGAREMPFRVAMGLKLLKGLLDPSTPSKDTTWSSIWGWLAVVLIVWAVGAMVR